MLKITPRCRLCLNTSSGTGVDLFLDSNGLIYSDQIREELGIELEEVPEWPREACLTCIVVLQKISRFRSSVIENDHKLRLEYCTVEPSQEEVEQQSAEDQLQGDFGMILEEEILEEVDIEMDIIDPDTFEVTEVQDNSPLIESPPRVVDVADSVSPSASSGGSFALLPVVTMPEKEEDSFLEIIAYESDSEVNEASPGQPVGAPSVRPSIERPPNRILAQDKAKPKNGGKVSLLRMSACKLTEEEEKLEALMVEMRLFVCKVCGSDCETFYGLRKHVNTVHDCKKYELCCYQRLTMPIQHLYDHIRWHLKSDSLYCEMCHRNFSNSTALAQHMAHKHSTEAPNVVCEVCGKGFFSMGQLNRHAEVHERVLCKYCGRDFAPSFLASHIKALHEVEVNSLCDICGAGFASQSKLMIHRVDHAIPIFWQPGRPRKKKLKL